MPVRSWSDPSHAHWVTDNFGRTRVLVATVWMELSSLHKVSYDNDPDLHEWGSRSVVEAST